MVSSGKLRRVTLVRTDVSEELNASFIRVTLGRLVFLCSMCQLRQVPPKRRFLQKPHGVTSQKTPFFTVIIFPRHPGREH
jgi:hypothetical protein